MDVLEVLTSGILRSYDNNIFNGSCLVRLMVQMSPTVSSLISKSITIFSLPKSDLDLIFLSWFNALKN